MKKILKVVIGCFLLLVISQPNRLYAVDSKSNVIVTNCYDDATEVISNREITKDFDTNLLKSTAGENLQKVIFNKKNYLLDAVTITRNRQAIKIEYYLGDYTQSTFIGSDEGYADYDDYMSDYYLSVPEINNKFGLSIPTTHRLKVISENTPYLVPEYDVNNELITVKILVAEVKSYAFTFSKYQNRQDIQNPIVVGKTMSEIDTLTEHWKVNSLSVSSHKAIIGQEIALKDVGSITDTYTTSGRLGQLTSYGIYDENGLFVVKDKITVTADTPISSSGRIQVAVFYEVDDFGSPLVKPSYSSSFTSGASVGFVGSDVIWKSASVSERLDLSNDTLKAKLESYPFNYEGDPFDNPEHILDWPPVNWLLGHKLNITYEYKLDPFAITYYTVSFNTNGGDDIAPLTKIEANTLITLVVPKKPGYKFVGWFKDIEFNKMWQASTDRVNSDITLYAKWEQLSIIVNPEKLPQTGMSGLRSASILILITVMLGVIQFGWKKMK